jgi:hypothetical protein
MKSSLFEWKLMPFGLKNAMITFSPTMSNVFKDWTNQFLKIFVDDVNVHGNDWKDYLDHLNMVFDKLKMVNLNLNLGKCCFGVKEITFLRHVINQQGSRLDPTKIQGGSQFPLPLIITNLRFFWDSHDITCLSYMDMPRLLHLCLN